MAATYRFAPADSCVMCGGTATKVLGRRLNRHQGFRPKRSAGVTVTVVRCEECGLIYANPRPVPEAVEQHYDVPPEAYWNEHHLLSNDGYGATEIARFRDLWRGDHRPRALDVGAGVGLMMLALTDAGFDTNGIEPSPQFRNRAIDNGLPANQIQLAELEEAEYPSASFDFVTFGAVLEHLHDPAAAIERALDWLAPRGLIHVEVPSARWLIGRLINLSYRIRGLDFVSNLSPMHPPYHLYEFTLESFERHGQRAGYRTVAHRFFACETLLARPASRVATWIMERTDTGMQLQVWLQAVA
jgi:SAM-dependent methyltransferase